MESNHIKLIIRDDNITISLFCDKNKLKRIKYFNTMFNYGENSCNEIIISVTNALITHKIINKYLTDDKIKNDHWIDLIEKLKEQIFIMLDLEPKITLDKLITQDIPESNYLDLLKEAEFIPYTKRLGKLLLRNLPYNFDLNLLPKFFVKKFIELANNGYNIISIDNSGKIQKCSSLDLAIINKYSNICTQNFITLAYFNGNKLALIYNFFSHKKIEFWDLNNCKITNTYFDEQYYGIDFCPINNKCVVTTLDKKYIMSPYEKEGLIELEHDELEKSCVFTSRINYIPIKYFPDGLSVISVTKNSNISVWSTSDQILKYRIDTNHFISDLACSPNNNIFASCGKDIILWDRKYGNQINVLLGHSESVICIKFSSNGKYLVSGSYDKTIKLWDVESGHLLKTFVGHQEEITRVYFSPNNKDIISVGLDNTIKIWNIKTGKMTGEILSERTILDISFDCEPNKNILDKFKNYL
ncbi:wd-repeat family protein [Moumouvirus maliensis]|nr:wd-repeat family protein [Moumouvirus maliensis]